MKHTKKLLALLLATVLCLGLSAGAFAAEKAAPANADVRTTLADSYEGKTVILHSNDVHGALEGYARISQLRKELEASGAEVILVDAGDFSQGTPYVSLSRGASAVKMMNAAGYDFVTLGNHEFDYGYAQLMENLKNAEFKPLCANVLLRDSNESILDGHAIYETRGGVKLGFFGLETPETATKVNPGLIEKIDFTFGKALSAAAQKEIDALKAEGASLVIGLTHLGVDEESATYGHRSLDVYAAVTGADLLIDGHSHTVMTQGPDGQPITSTGTKFAYVGVVVIGDDGRLEDRFLVPTESLAQDETVAAAAKSIIEAVDAEYAAPFATSQVMLNGERAPNGNRDSQTNTGNLITDAMLYAVQSVDSITKVDADHTVAMVNGGSIRASIQAGPISMKDVNSVLPFGNTVAVIYVSGAELLEALEASTYILPVAGYPQTSGIQWTLDTTKTFDRGPVYLHDGKETTYYSPASIQRVSIQSVNGRPFDPDATYAVVTSDFVAAGGDTYAVFHKAYLRTDEFAGFDTTIPLDEVLMNYVQTALNGVISTKYATDRGDLTTRTMENSSIAAGSGKVSVAGKTATPESYTINGENYFKLRDIAALLNGTSSQFEVSFDSESNTVMIETGKAYTAVGGELEPHADRSASCAVSAQRVTVNGTPVHLTAFSMEDNNFFSMDGLGSALGLAFDFDAETYSLAA